MKYHIWNKLSQEAIKTRVFKALSENVNYKEENVLGIPATYLDEKVFSQDEFFLKDAPYISALASNANHIGCHTLGTSEKYFQGTQAIERELIEICAVDILKAQPDTIDGYVASGGTEANMQAVWVYRNYFVNEKNASLDEICILTSEDSHYSVDKSANILVLDVLKVAVDFETRDLSKAALEETVVNAKKAGKKYFIVFSNMMTTMFGSVDTISTYTDVLDAHDCEYKLHVDGAYGGFYYPFVKGETAVNFSNPAVSSITLDAHKMAQAPYGTGIFLMRKGLIDNVHTKEASYVSGEDCTLIGSRSGANAIAVWMILVKNGPFGWQEKIYLLQKRAEWICDELSQMGISYFRHKRSNIVTINSDFLDADVAKEFGLVPDNHLNPKWYKIVIMEHVTIEKMIPLVERLREFQLQD